MQLFATNNTYKSYANPYCILSASASVALVRCVLLILCVQYSSKYWTTDDWATIADRYLYERGFALHTRAGFTNTVTLSDNPDLFFAERALALDDKCQVSPGFAPLISKSCSRSLQPEYSCSSTASGWLSTFRTLDCAACMSEQSLSLLEATKFKSPSYSRVPGIIRTTSPSVSTFFPRTNPLR